MSTREAVASRLALVFASLCERRGGTRSLAARDGQAVVGYTFGPRRAGRSARRANHVDQNLLRSYFATIYELSTETGTVRASIDGELVRDENALPPLFRQSFAILTAYNPRSMLLPRRVNESRHLVMRDLLILGCYRVEQCVGYEEEPEGVWREPAWIVHGVDRDEAINFGRTFRQNTVIYCRGNRPELIVTDPTCDPVGKTYQGNWRVRS